ncbi:hypothetical protein CTI12_AA110330 [Artemisia annua]|uniref:DUF4057 domain-containing protein n=1 Tax=Artemisia annua TaxID=35608 RepID=A0A2U1PUY5_ARTAN|nr:hypothetical protein CTI12_AA110330 [Artemisia annua]
MSQNRKPNTSTADLLTWSETPPADSPATGSSSVRSHQPSDGISKVVFGGQVTDEEVESLNKRKPVSGYKLKEITGSGIFAPGGENGVEETDAANRTPSNPTGIRMYQQAVAGISHISFGEEETVSPKKSISEAKQRELSGTLDSESEARLKKQISDAKNRELSGHNIFAPPPEIKPRPLAARALALRENITVIGEPAPLNVRISTKISYIVVFIIRHICSHTLNQRICVVISLTSFERLGLIFSPAQIEIQMSGYIILKCRSMSKCYILHTLCICSHFVKSKGSILPVAYF